MHIKNIFKELYICQCHYSLTLESTILAKASSFALLSEVRLRIGREVSCVTFSEGLFLILNGFLNPSFSLGTGSGVCSLYMNICNAGFTACLPAESLL